MKDKKIPVYTQTKDIMIPLPHKDIDRWIGEYILSSMVIGAWKEGRELPDRVGRIGAIHELEDGGCNIEYEAEWDDDDKPKRKVAASETNRKASRPRSRVRKGNK